MISVRCPRCGNEFTVEDAMRGRADRCPSCATPVRVPAASNETATVVHTETRFTRSPVDGDSAEVERYLTSIIAAVCSASVFPATGVSGELFVTVTMNPDQRSGFTTHSTPAEVMPDPAALAHLLAALFAVPAPAVSGTAEAVLVFRV